MRRTQFEAEVTASVRAIQKNGGGCRLSEPADTGPVRTALILTGRLAPAHAAARLVAALGVRSRYIHYSRLHPRALTGRVVPDQLLGWIPAHVTAARIRLCLHTAAGLAAAGAGPGGEERGGGGGGGRGEDGPGAHGGGDQGVAGQGGPRRPEAQGQVGGEGEGRVTRLCLGVVLET